MHAHPAFLAPAAMLAAMAAFVARAEAVETGQVLAEVSLRQVEGGTAPLVDRGAGATAVVFFKPDQERSLETLKIMGRCQAALAAKPVRWVGIVPADTVAGAAQGAVAASGMKLALLVDDGDALYAKLGIRMHPGIAVVDRARTIVAYEPFHQVDYCGIVTARIRRALGEISDAEVATAIAPPQSALPGGDDKAGIAKRHLLFGRKLLDAKAYPAAHENARKATALQPSAGAWTLEGDVFVAEGNCAEAAKAFDAALAIDPKSAGATAGKSRCGK